MGQACFAGLSCAQSADPRSEAHPRCSTRGACRKSMGDRADQQPDGAPLFSEFSRLEDKTTFGLDKEDERAGFERAASVATTDLEMDQCSELSSNESTTGDAIRFKIANLLLESGIGGNRDGESESKADAAEVVAFAMRRGLETATADDIYHAFMLDRESSNGMLEDTIPVCPPEDTVPVSTFFTVISGATHASGIVAGSLTGAAVGVALSVPTLGFIAPITVPLCTWKGGRAGHRFASRIKSYLLHPVRHLRQIPRQ